MRPMGVVVPVIWWVGLAVRGVGWDGREGTDEVEVSEAGGFWPWEGGGVVVVVGFVVEVDVSFRRWRRSWGVRLDGGVGVAVLLLDGDGVVDGEG